MYVVPAHADPVYGTARDKEWRFELPSIRALPVQPGDVLVWNQAVLHGAAARRPARSSRASAWRLNSSAWTVRLSPSRS